MNLGKINLGGESISLLVIMMIAAIIGGYVKIQYNDPDNLLRRSVERSLETSFSASLEGSTSLRNNVLAFYRTRQRYSPGTGAVVVSDRSEITPGGGEHGIPLDAGELLRALTVATSVEELDREDMYGHGTRHLTGRIVRPDDSPQVGRVFEFWMDMDTLLPVRLTVSEVQRNVGISGEGEYVAKEVYVNVRFRDFPSER